MSYTGWLSCIFTSFYVLSILYFVMNVILITFSRFFLNLKLPLYVMLKQYKIHYQTPPVSSVTMYNKVKVTNRDKYKESQSMAFVYILPNQESRISVMNFDYVIIHGSNKEQHWSLGHYMWLLFQCSTTHWGCRLVIWEGVDVLYLHNGQCSV